MPTGLLTRIRQAPAQIACAVLLLGELASAAWYQVQAQAIRTTGILSFVAPEGWRETAPETAQVRNLHFDRGRRYQFSPSPDVVVDVLALEYEPNPVTLKEIVGHHVKVCTAYAGAEVLQEFPAVKLAVWDQKMEMDSILALDRAGTRWYVFKAVWLFSKTRLSHRERLALMFEPTLANPPALVLMASISGVPNYEEARRMFDRHCLRHVQSNSWKKNGS